MRRIYYGKRTLDTGEYGYIFANDDINDDPNWPICEENIYAAGLKMSIVCSDKDITELCDFDVEDADTISGCKAVMRSKSSDWKIAAVQVDPGRICIYFVNKKAYKVESQLMDCDANKYEVYATLEGCNANGVTLEFALPNSICSSIMRCLIKLAKAFKKLPNSVCSSMMRCRIRVGYDFTEVTEFADSRKRFFTFVWGTDERGEDCPCVSETECIY